jgi:hypothetical protein
MAGDWLKMRHDLADDPSIIRTAADLGIDEDAVLGKCFRLWSWADRHTTDGQASGIGLAWVDRLTRCDGFGAALVRAGWLAELDGGLCFPRFDRHCSDTAKQRALDSRLKAEKRDVRQRAGQKPDKCPDPIRTTAGPEKRREEDPPPPREAAQGEPEATDGGWLAFRKLWNDGAAAGNRKVWKPATPPDGWTERLSEGVWLEHAGEAIGRLAKCRYFDTPVTLPQFLGPRFVPLCLGGQYDAAKAKKGGREPEKAPPAVWTGDDAQRFEATKRKVLESLTKETT